MIVEKPGVAFLDNPANPGTAENCSDAFEQEHTIDRWRDALDAALTSALSMPAIDPRHVLVVGHSEGGIMAASLAARNPKVSHVAMLSSNGPTQLYDLATLARRRNESKPVEEREAAVNDVYATYELMMKTPDSWSTLAWGHPYRRWTTFLSTSTVEEICKSQASVYVAHGTQYTSVPIESADLLRAELSRRGRAVVFDRREGANHSLNKPNQTGPTGMREVLTEVAKWFLN